MCVRVNAHVSRNKHSRFISRRVFVFFVCRPCAYVSIVRERPRRSEAGRPSHEEARRELGTQLHQSVEASTVSSMFRFVLTILQVRETTGENVRKLFARCAAFQQTCHIQSSL